MKNSVLYILFALLISCGSQDEQMVENQSEPTQNGINLTEEQKANSEITTGMLKKRMFSSKIICSGNIEPTPRGMAHISSPFGGFITRLDLYIGSKVRKGQSLVWIENPEFIEIQKEFLKARANYLYLEREYVRQKELNEENAASSKIMEQAEAEFLSAKADFQSATEKIKMLGLRSEDILENGIKNEITISSPISGYISKIHGNIGKYLLPEDVIFEIIDPANLHLHLRVFEKDISKLSVGQVVNFSTLAEPQKLISAEIFSLGKSVDEENHTITVHARLLTRDENLVPGIYINASINTETDSLYAIPLEGLIIGEETNYIFIYKEGRYFKVPVETGVEEEDYFSIINPPQNIVNYPVVLNGAYFINAAIEGSEEE